MSEQESNINEFYDKQLNSNLKQEPMSLDQIRNIIQQAKSNAKIKKKELTKSQSLVNSLKIYTQEPQKQ